MSKNWVNFFWKTGKKSNQFILFSFLRSRIFMKVFPSHKYKGVIFPSRCWNGAIEMEESDFLIHTPLTYMYLGSEQKNFNDQSNVARRTELAWSSIGGDREACHCGGPGWGGSYSQVVLGPCLSPHSLSTSNFSLHTIFRLVVAPSVIWCQLHFEDMGIVKPGIIAPIPRTAVLVITPRAWYMLSEHSVN